MSNKDIASYRLHMVLDDYANNHTTTEPIIQPHLTIPTNREAVLSLSSIKRKQCSKGKYYIMKTTLLLSIFLAAICTGAKAQLVNNCTRETLAIAVNTTLDEIAQAAYNNQIQLQDPLTCGTSGTELICSYDYAKAESNYVQVCNAAGGQVADASFDVYCKVENTGNVRFAYTAAPNCIGKSCDLTASKELLTNLTNEHAAWMNTIDGVSDCKAELSGISAATTSGVVGVILASTIATFMGFVA